MLYWLEDATVGSAMHDEKGIALDKQIHLKLYPFCKWSSML